MYNEMFFVVSSFLKELHILPMTGIFRNRYRKVSKEKYDEDLQHKRAVFLPRGRRGCNAAETFHVTDSWLCMESDEGFIGDRKVELQ